MSDEIKWKWFYGPAFSIGWDVAFQAPSDLLENEKYNDRFPFQGLGQLSIQVDKKSSTKQLTFVKNLPGNFNAAVMTSRGVIDRKLFPWIMEVTAEAAADWEKEWTEPTVTLDLATGSEDEAEALGAKARQRADLARTLKGGRP